MDKFFLHELPCVIVGNKTRVLSSLVLAKSTQISSQSILGNSTESISLLENASKVIFTSYIKNTRGGFDIDKSVKLAEDVLRFSSHSQILFMSSDHVFSGNRGSYSVDDTPDPVSEYGKLKCYQEEVFSKSTILRFTVMGPSFSTRPLITDLVRSSEVCYCAHNDFFSPVSSYSVNRFLLDHISGKTKPKIYHLSSEKVSKYDLFCLIAQYLNPGLLIQSTSGSYIDHSLSPSPGLSRVVAQEVSLACNFF